MGMGGFGHSRTFYVERGQLSTRRGVSRDIIVPPIYNTLVSLRASKDRD